MHDNPISGKAAEALVRGVDDVSAERHVVVRALTPAPPAGRKRAPHDAGQGEGAPGLDGGPIPAAGLSGRGPVASGTAKGSALDDRQRAWLIEELEADLADLADLGQSHLVGRTGWEPTPVTPFLESISPASRSRPRTRRRWTGLA